MASIIARCVPGSYDTLEDAAKGLAHATLACALLGTVGYLGTGYCAGIVAMQCLLLSAMANRNAGLLKVCVVCVRAMVITLSLSSSSSLVGVWLLRFRSVRSVRSVRPLDAFVVDWMTSCVHSRRDATV